MNSSSPAPIEFTSMSSAKTTTGFKWQHGLGLGVVSVFILWFWLGTDKIKPTETRSPVLPAKEELSIQYQPSSEPQIEQNDRAWQLEQERLAAEILKQQQVEALKRFEERRQQESDAPSQAEKYTNPQYLEHLHSLCAEWGATMECQSLKKRQ